MKAGLFSAAVVLGCLMCFASCSGGLRIEKRHYRDGFYIGGNRHAGTTAGNPDGVKRGEDAGERNETAASADSSVKDTTRTVITATPVRRDSAISTVPEDEFSKDPNQSTVVMDSSLPNETVEIPVSARRMNTLSWVALGIIALGIIASIVAFLPGVSAGFGVLIAAAPFLVLAALGLGIWLLITAKRRKLAATNSDLQNYYDKIRKRARWIVILASAVIVVFVLFLALVIVALSNFT